jgi:hypothetical protein
MKRMNSDIGKRINIFDNYEIQTVETFNKLFPECPIKNTEQDVEVGIGNPSTGNTRLIIMKGQIFKHKMFSNELYGIDRDKFLNDEIDKELDEIMGHPI